MRKPNKSTQFQIGNQAWRSRSSHGRKPRFKTPKDLEAASIEYFDWVEANPLYQVELVKYQGSAIQVKAPKMRAMTLVGLRNFLGIALSTWQEYRKKPDFSVVTERVENIIYCQKFAGAAAGLLNANIISYELGLTDRRDIDVDIAEPVTSITFVEIDGRIPPEAQNEIH